MKRTMNIIRHTFVERGWCLLILSLWACAISAQNIEAQLDSTKIRIGEQASLRVSVTASKNAAIVFPSLKPQSEIAEHVEVVDIIGDTLSAGNDQQTVSRNYQLTGWEEVNATIPAQVVTVDGRELTTPLFNLQIVGEPNDTLQQMFPIADIQDNPFAWSDWYLVMGLTAALMAAIAVIVWLSLRLKGNRPIFKTLRISKRLTPHEKALQEIERLKSAQEQTADDEKTYYTRLTDVLRTYLSERFGIRAMEMTSQEILDVLRNKQIEDKTAVAELHNVFETADLVKFAKFSVLETDQNWHLACVAKFIEDTKQEQADTETTKPIVDEQEKMAQRRRRMTQGLIITMSLIAVALLGWIAVEVYELVA